VPIKVPVNRASFAAPSEIQAAATEILGTQAKLEESTKSHHDGTLDLLLLVEDHAEM
jgi:hypothetical protein